MKFKRNFATNESLEASLEQLQAHMDDSPVTPEKADGSLVGLADMELTYYGEEHQETEVVKENKRAVDKNSDGYVVSQVYDLPDKKKDERALWLYENMGNLCKWYFGKEGNRTQEGGIDALGNTLLADLSHKKVASAIKLVSESADKEYNFPLSSVALFGRILGFLNINANLMPEDFNFEKISEKIYQAGLGVLRSHGRDDEFFNETNMGKYSHGNELATDLLFVVPSVDVINFNANTYIADSVKAVIALLIGTCTSYEDDGQPRAVQFPFSMNDVIGILRALYTQGNDSRYLTRVARTIILEPASGYNGLNKQQDEALEIILDAALEIIETSGDKEAMANMMYYCKTRQYADKGGMDYTRLIEIPDLDLTDFPNIGAAVSRIKRDHDKQNLARYIK